MEKYINKVIQGDCLEKLKELEDNSVDSIVTDPPAGISFMGKSWDSDKGGRDNWIKWMFGVATECKRVLKPGGHAFVWAIPRTSHWTATAWENAGFEIRDVVAHIFGSGFPKSHNVEKAIQKINLDRSEEFKGIGTALKPAREDWILMRKPLEKGLIVAENCLKWGTGGINIDESRVKFEDTKDVAHNPLYRYQNKDKYRQVTDNGQHEGVNVKFTNSLNPPSELGRFPANLIHDNSEEVRECFPETKSGSYKGEGSKSGGIWSESTGKPAGMEYGDSGNASRFFKSIIYQAKASKSDRGQGNNHATVKPTALMEYLIKMVTPKGGIVLDPFAGSGTTGVACKNTNRNYILIEKEPEYVVIINKRLENLL